MTQSKASVEAVENLHATVVTELTKAIKEGVRDVSGNILPAPAAYFKEARELLKDNGVTADVTHNPALGNLIGALPFPDGDTDEIRIVPH